MPSNGWYPLELSERAVRKAPRYCKMGVTFGCDTSGGSAQFRGAFFQSGGFSPKKIFRRNTMLRRTTFSLIGVAGLVAAMRASAQVAAFGTSADAKAMLEKVVAAMKADPAKTIALINK